MCGQMVTIFVFVYKI